jgi:hypothetical protein
MIVVVVVVVVGGGGGGGMVVIGGVFVCFEIFSALSPRPRPVCRSVLLLYIYN